mmetsp:Transcript_53933/g.127448  ORF Transcript_53933/g.127448 Transcript_53933/m.127448 type:complete len:442 (+) Transcript_53933:115-1440(+)
MQAKGEDVVSLGASDSQEEEEEHDDNEGFPHGEGTDEAGEGSSSAKRTVLIPRRKKWELHSRAKSNRIELDLDKETVSKYFKMPLLEAATKIGIGATTLKRVCRRLGITRWPFARGPSQQKGKERQQSSAPDQHSTGGESATESAARVGGWAASFPNMGVDSAGAASGLVGGVSLNRSMPIPATPQPNLLQNFEAMAAAGISFGGHAALGAGSPSAAAPRMLPLASAEQPTLGAPSASSTTPSVPMTALASSLIQWSRGQGDAMPQQSLGPKLLAPQQLGSAATLDFLQAHSAAHRAAPSLPPQPKASQPSPSALTQAPSVAARGPSDSYLVSSSLLQNPSTLQLLVGRPSLGNWPGLTPSGIPSSLPAGQQPQPPFGLQSFFPDGTMPQWMQQQGVQRGLVPGQQPGHASLQALEGGGLGAPSLQDAQHAGVRTTLVNLM